MKKIVSVLTILSLLASPAWSFCYHMININTADKDELMTLYYVGEAIAEKIIEYRKIFPFVIPEDIMNVEGIGKKIFDRNKDCIYCS